MSLRHVVTTGFWMSDKPLVQQELAENLAAMIHAQSDDRAVQFLSGFWHTIGREWGGIDRLRCE
jgi:ribosomal RNA-processing protein 1